MHFLCLHGVGTNSKIMEMQTAALRYELGDDHTYDYGEGIFTTPLAPEVKDFATGESSGFSHFPLTPGADLLQPVQDLEDFIASEGPYDGVIAFSQGIMTAATLIVRNAQEGKPVPFKCAVFFSPRMGPLDLGETSRAGRAVEVDPKAHPGVIPLPTALIWGSRDLDRAKAEEIKPLFAQDLFSTYIHSGGHEVPGTGSNEAVIRSVNVIRRTIDAVTAVPLH
ncbi:serine hydrolase FSH [Aspergillus undulatus]|uniref:serine hydrolase FSH n=1 Tax=Aspergillus undulatus TaxID=1810928 RepID=UPI003CCE4A89